MLSRLMGTKEQELEIPGLPRDFAKVVARIQGREPSNDDRLRLAAGQDAASVMAISTAINAKPPEPEKPAFDPRNTNIGEKLEDGTIYLGFHNGRDWYATEQDAKDSSGRKLTMNFNQAADYAKNLNLHGHNDWQVPDKEMLNIMYQNKHTGAFRGTYDESGSFTAGYYWSSTELRVHSDVAWRQRFVGGHGGWFGTDDAVSVRCVRSEPRP